MQKKAKNQTREDIMRNYEVHVTECRVCGRIKRLGKYQHIHEMNLSKETHRELLFTNRRYVEVCPECKKEREQAIALMNDYHGL